jgi:outer membrane protein assembly factor BamB
MLAQYRRSGLAVLISIIVLASLAGTLVIVRLATQPATQGIAKHPTPTATLAALPPIRRQAILSDWTTYMGGSDHAGFNANERSLTPASVTRLALKWTIGNAAGASVQPIESDGMLYWGTWDGLMHAATLSGKMVWQQNLGQTYAPACVYPKLVGVASTATLGTIGQTPVIFVGGGDASVYALNAATGKVMWRKNLGSSPEHFLWSSTVLDGRNLYIGMSSFGDCPLVQGQLIQLNSDTGAIQHVFNIVPPGCIGGSLWGTPTLDVATGIIYIATGNPGDCDGAEPYTYAVVALHAATLTPIASWRVPAADQGEDSDFGSTPTLFTATIHGVPHNLVGVVNKNGFFYAFDRANIGAGPVWEQSLAYGNDCPDCGDGSISPAAWDGTRVYVGGGHTTIGGIACQGSVSALNPATGAFLWRRCTSGPVLTAISMARGIVVATEGANIDVIDAATGAALWHYSDPDQTTAFYGAASIARGQIFAEDLAGTFFALGL